MLKVLWILRDEIGLHTLSSFLVLLPWVADEQVHVCLPWERADRAFLGDVWENVSKIFCT